MSYWNDDYNRCGMYLFLMSTLIVLALLGLIFVIIGMSLASEKDERVVATCIITNHTISKQDMDCYKGGVVIEIPHIVTIIVWMRKFNYTCDKMQSYLNKTWPIGSSSICYYLKSDPSDISFSHSNESLNDFLIVGIVFCSLAGGTFLVLVIFAFWTDHIRIKHIAREKEIFMNRPRCQVCWKNFTELLNNSFFENPKYEKHCSTCTYKMILFRIFMKYEKNFVSAFIKSVAEEVER